MATYATYSGGSGTGADPYQISNIAEWITLTTTPTDWGRHFILIADLDFAGTSVAPIGGSDPQGTCTPLSAQAPPFAGSIDGNGHVLCNAVINLPENNYVGLVGWLERGGAISNLRVNNVAVTGRAHVGCLVGWNADGDVTACRATNAHVTGRRHVGGLVGYNSGRISSCHADGDVTAWDNAGGLIGSGRAVAESCTSATTVACPAAEAVSLTSSYDRALRRGDLETAAQCVQALGIDGAAILSRLRTRWVAYNPYSDAYGCGFANTWQTLSCSPTEQAYMLRDGDYRARLATRQERREAIRSAERGYPSQEFAAMDFI